MTTLDSNTEALKKTADYLYVIKESEVLGKVDPELFEAISMLRQLINEEYVHNEKSVSSQLIYDMIAPAVSKAVLQGKLETLSKIKEWDDNDYDGEGPGVLEFLDSETADLERQLGEI